MYDILMNKSHFLVYAKWSIIILFWQFAILSIYLVSNNNLSRIKTHAATNELDDFLKQKERNVIQTKVQKHAGFLRVKKKSSNHNFNLCRSFSAKENVKQHQQEMSDEQ